MYLLKLISRLKGTVAYSLVLPRRTREDASFNQTSKYTTNVKQLQTQISNLVGGVVSTMERVIILNN